ncbi:hypothetical protein ANSO36C_32120 [Nostoc cf. commune SO-36]|uniref:Uncharacterized protein n=1 Tax=Nostoc cf. commune SO-36 TaxID=449208 RepID=A0ABM7Z339_NOSCO|nr:hypothetical protein [Nostoc commune]BDI17410.1 hypothetical protein ANSO36C_32120 [Nostoc cf. commune SO-36]
MRFDELEKERQRNRTLAQEKFSERISVIKNCIDTQHLQCRRDAAKIAVQSATIFISPQARQVVREYSRLWQLAPSINS